jgi:hypothetical protein
VRCSRKIPPEVALPPKKISVAVSLYTLPPKMPVTLSMNVYSHVLPVEKTQDRDMEVIPSCCLQRPPSQHVLPRLLQSNFPTRRSHAISFTLGTGCP